MDPKWNAIVIHHSDTKDDGEKNDWNGICTFQTSYRLRGNIITPEEGERLIALGEPVERPWKMVGYHFGIEYEGGQIVYRQGRPLTMVGAHCIGMNNRAIGICGVGDFDKIKPTDAFYEAQADICAMLIKKYPAITPDSIFPHSKFAEKTCPGKLYDMERLVKFVKIILGGNFDGPRSIN